MDRTVDTREHILETAEAIIVVKGFSAVGLAEILAAAGVPKGSFYHWFASKEAFGVALLERYFAGYLSRLGDRFEATASSGRMLVEAYFADWLALYSEGCSNAQQCLVVKLAAEVADLSEPMRQTLATGVAAITGKISGVIAAAQADASLPADKDPDLLAAALYSLWIGASILAKAQRSSAPLDAALEHTKQLLQR